MNNKVKRLQSTLMFLAIHIEESLDNEKSDVLIMPGSISFSNPQLFKGGSQFFSVDWKQVVSKDIDGAKSLSFESDLLEPRFKSIDATKRIARTIFFASAPKLQKIVWPEILLGICLPEQVIGTYEMALKKYSEKTQFLHTEGQAYNFDIHISLTALHKVKKEQLTLAKDIIPKIKEELHKFFTGSSVFSKVHFFPDSLEVPDDIGLSLQLIILSPEPNNSYSKVNFSNLSPSVKAILRKNGKETRVRQNRLLFLLADSNCLSKLNESINNYLAWEALNTDLAIESLVLKEEKIKILKNSIKDSFSLFLNNLKDTYKWILNPAEKINNGKLEINWKFIPLNSSISDGNFLPVIEEKVLELDWIIKDLSPEFLREILEEFYFINGRVSVVTNQLVSTLCPTTYGERCPIDEYRSKIYRTNNEAEIKRISPIKRNENCL
jgi:hypothetical protein